MNRAYYYDNIKKFLNQEQDIILAEMVSNNQFDLTDLQRNSWIEEIKILKEQLKYFDEGYVALEYTIPRIGKRIDAVFLYKGVVFLLEFKVGNSAHTNKDKEQVIDYALDLNSFHKESYNKLLVPILICTESKYGEFDEEILYKSSEERFNVQRGRILEVQLCNKENLAECIRKVAVNHPNEMNVSPLDWINSIYMPSPTIVEAAQALYHGHRVEDISRNDANATNLTKTTEAIAKIIDYSKNERKKSICFVTGVPGAGKTLAGLNIAVDRQRIDENEHAVFLSGNGPLVEVLQESLARDDVKRNGIRKNEAKRKAKEFIQNIHHFRDDALALSDPPIEKVAIFDEAQRAWDDTNLSNFMKRKKGKIDFNYSEPEFLIDVMNRHEDWSVIICLIGGGQEINTGEAGLPEWFNSLNKKFRNWEIYVSDRIVDYEYTSGKSLVEMFQDLHCTIERDLHLSVSLRSFRSEKVSDFVKAVLDVNREAARDLYLQFKDVYPICITRDLIKAKKWIRNKAKGSQRYGMIASSGAKRLRSHGIWVQNKIDAPNWFLNDKNDVRSSFFMEETATEFDIQGLELDWTLLCWDADLRFIGGEFKYFNFAGTKWQVVGQERRIQYLKNTYRVLMTRARQGFVIFVPCGDNNDTTRKTSYYNGIYNYFISLGLESLD
ncbi:MAG: DUF2075 domain-containing protein [Tissierellia bacterium]|nr:DUF2075 domain-containing protein [Tissierellia bacterium]